MMSNLNSKAILFLYEGETEGEFYPKIFRSYLPLSNRTIRMSSQCLGGNFSINTKVVNSIYNYIEYAKSKRMNIKQLYVFIALDRDNREQFMAPINLNYINGKVNSKIVKSIDTIVATQDFESWLFLDIANIFKFLRTPVHLRNESKYKNYQSFNNKDLSRLFSKYGKEYKKGKKVDGLLNSLDLSFIHDNCQDLKGGVATIKKLFT